jgi:hypothetical protein
LYYLLIMYYALPFESINNIDNWILFNQSNNSYVYYSHSGATIHPVIMKIPFGIDLSKNKLLINEIETFQKKLVLINNKNTCNLLDSVKSMEKSTKPITIKFKPIINNHIHIEVIG